MGGEKQWQMLKDERSRCTIPSFSIHHFPSARLPASNSFPLILSFAWHALRTCFEIDDLYLAPGEYTRGRLFFGVNPARRVFTAG